MIINASGYDEGRPKLTLLWTNPNPTAEFKANQVAEFDRGDYSVLYIACLASDKYQYLTTTPVINDANIVGQTVRCRAGMTAGSRTITLSDNGIIFSTGTYESCATNGSLSASTGTKYVIPYKIYGGV